MEQIYEQGGAKAIGVANFFPDRLVDLIEHNGVTPAVNQIETHPFHQRGADHEVIKAHDVQHESWGPWIGHEDAQGRHGSRDGPRL